MRVLIVMMLVAAFTLGATDVWAGQAGVPPEAETQALKAMAAAIPLGSRVRAETNDGKRVSGTLMSVSEEAVIIKKRTRLPEPAVTLPFTGLARLELQTSEGMNAGKVIGIGLAAGAGAILTLFAFFAALAD